jgi:hypothetical protein
VKTIIITAAAMLFGRMAFASGWECSEVKDKPPEYSQGGSYLVTLSYDAARPGVPALLVISDALRPTGEQTLVTRKSADLQHKTGAQEQWPSSSVREATAYTSRAERLAEDKIDEIELLSFVVNANPATEKLKDREKRAGYVEVRFRDGRVRRDLDCSYKAK